jgi:ABC-2 type transport system ATP-binding protein
VGLADALLGSPPLLILDEPTAGLDPNQIREVRALIKRIGRDHTVLLSTHILPEVEATCSRALVIARGRLVAQGSVDEIRAMRRPSGLRVIVRGDADRAIAALREIPGVRRAEVKSRGEATSELSVSLKKGKEAGPVAEAIVSAIVGAGIGVREITAEAATLEQVFAELTEGDAAPPEDAAKPEPPRAEEASS